MRGPTVFLVPLPWWEVLPFIPPPGGRRPSSHPPSPGGRGTGGGGQEELEREGREPKSVRPAGGKGRYLLKVAPDPFSRYCFAMVSRFRHPARTKTLPARLPIGGWTCPVPVETRRPSCKVERRFEATRRNELWAGDITYIPTHSEFLAGYAPRPSAPASRPLATPGTYQTVGNRQERQGRQEKRDKPSKSCCASFEIKVGLSAWPRTRRSVEESRIGDPIRGSSMDTCAGVVPREGR